MARQRKREKSVQGYQKAILKILKIKGSPMREVDIFDRLRVREAEFDLADQALKDLYFNDQITLTDQGYSVPAGDAGVTGVIHVLPRGFGFVEPDDKEKTPKDIFVAGRYLNTAVDGDRVRVEITGHKYTSKGAEGRVAEVLERSRKMIAGTVTGRARPQGFTAYAPLLPIDYPLVVHKGDLELKIGDRFVAEVDSWGNDRVPTICIAQEVIGTIDDPAADVTCGIAEFEIRHEFPEEVTALIKKVPTEVTEEECGKRVDYRNTETVTIDPTTAKDFDDALSVSENKQGYQLIVHIADVSHYVQKGNPIDVEAKIRCNSTYFPGRCVPMLPPTLADNLCSLKPEVDRLTVSVEMNFDRQGTLQSHKIHKSVIRSDKRFTYEDALEVLEGRMDSPHGPLLKRMVELCTLLKKHKRERGNIEFALPELIINLDDNGAPSGTSVIPYDITHQMIEEFMLKANEVVALELTNRDHGLTYRVHEAPDPTALEEFGAVARAFGYACPPSPTVKDLQKLFDQVNGTPAGYQLSVSLIRSMKLAFYSPDNIGHYGLALEHYCHFTSPIRRYADLIVHRVLFEGQYDEEELIKVAKHCSEKERISSRAENSVLHLKKMRLLNQWKRESRSTFKAVVTKVKPVGFTFEVLDLMIEGFVHVSELKGYFEYDPDALSLTCVDKGVEYRCGTYLKVKVGDVDLLRRSVAWKLVGGKSKRS